MSDAVEKIVEAIKEAGAFGAIRMLMYDFDLFLSMAHTPWV